MSIQVACPHCNSHLSLNTKPGEQVRCPMCHQIFLAPRNQPPTAGQVELPSHLHGPASAAEHIPGQASLSGHSQMPGHAPMPGQNFQTGQSFPAGSGPGYFRPTSAMAIETPADESAPKKPATKGAKKGAKK